MNFCRLHPPENSNWHQLGNAGGAQTTICCAGKAPCAGGSERIALLPRQSPPPRRSTCRSVAPGRCSPTRATASCTRRDSSAPTAARPWCPCGAPSPSTRRWVRPALVKKMLKTHDLNNTRFYLVIIYRERQSCWFLRDNVILPSKEEDFFTRMNIFNTICWSLIHGYLSSGQQRHICRIAVRHSRVLGVSGDKKRACTDCY